MILNEVYFGKDSIKTLQDQFTKLRKKIKMKPVTSNTNLDTEVLKFNRIVEVTFGFKSFALYIQPSHLPNAYAWPVDTYYTEDEKKRIFNSITADATGFKYKKVFPGVSFIMAINSGLIDDDFYTDEELIAVMLHEIGHSFFDAVTNKDSKYTSARRLNLLVAKINEMIMSKIKSKEKVSTYSVSQELSKFSSAIISIRKNLHDLMPQFFSESMKDNMRRSRYDYTNEKFADTFAAMFGYSEELHRCLMKMTNKLYGEYYGVQQYPPFIEYTEAYLLYFNDFLNYVLNVQDEHPGDLARIKTSVDYLKREISKEGLDPKIKKELVSELNKLNKLIDDYINFPKDQDSMRIIRIYYTLLYKNFGGDRREQDTDNDALFSAIDDRYEELNN